MEVAAKNTPVKTETFPAEWAPVALGDVGTWCSGGTPAMSNAAYWTGEIPWVSAKDMKVSHLRDAIDHISAKAVASGAKVLPVGAVLMVVRGMILAHSFPVALTEVPLAFNQDLKAVVAREGVDSTFLLYWLTASGQYLRSLTTESTHGTKRLPTESLFREELHLPPLQEQRAIAAALVDVDALLVKLDHLTAKKRNLKLAAMQQLLTGKTRLPGFVGQWRKHCLGDVGTFSKGAGIKKDQVLAEGIPCVRYGELYTRHEDYIRQFHSFISPEIACESKLLRRGDLLFAGSGETAEEIGKCVAFLGTEEAYAGGDIVIFGPRHQDSLYLGYLMNHPTVVAQKARMGQGDAVVHIGARNLAALEVLLPDYAEQSAIAAIICDMDAEIAALESRRDKTRALKQGMMQELLTGRIRLV